MTLQTKITARALTKMGAFEMNMQTIGSSVNDMGFHNPPLERIDTCQTHGEYKNICYVRSIWLGCTKCMKLRSDAAEAKEQERKREEERRQWKEKIGNAGIPERFITRTLSTYQADEKNDKQVRVLKFCTEYAENFNEHKKTGLSFLMLGLPGTGKTHLSIGIAFEVMKNGHSSVFTTASRMLRAIKDTYHKGSEFSEMQVLATYETCDLLIIDEIGVQTGSDYEKNIIFDVINSRYENVRPTIILSNLSIDECKLYLGERVFDRMREGGGKAFLLDWPSFRK
ncbi:MAG: ATP-binding protein [Chitinophagaceae bacterium]|nr:ATP-binding protein [Chitinophagaceae bacterium]